MTRISRYAAVLATFALASACAQPGADAGTAASTAMNPTEATPAPVAASSAAPPPAATTQADMMPEQQVRDSLVESSWTLFEQRDFAAIERMAAQYRDPRERTPSGLWKLTMFYAGAYNYTHSLQPCAAHTGELDAYFAAWQRAVPDSPTLPLVRARQRLCAAQDRWAQAPEGDPTGHDALLRDVGAVREDLQARRALADADPYWFEVRLVASWLEGYRGQRQGVLDDLSTHHPVYYQAWFQAMDSALKEPGVDEALDALARQAAQAGLPDEGDAMYARMYWHAFLSRYHDEGFRDSPVDWPRMKRGIDAVLARYPDPWNVNFFARIACAHGDAAETAALLARVGRHPLPQAWPGPDEYRACLDGSAFGTTTAAL